jgi:hypothetical protein
VLVTVIATLSVLVTGVLVARRISEQHRPVDLEHQCGETRGAIAQLIRASCDRVAGGYRIGVLYERGRTTGLVLKYAPSSCDRSVDVPDRTIAQVIANGVVFAAGDVSPRFAQIIDCLVNSAAVVWTFIDRRMEGRILTVIDRCVLDFANRGIDSAHSFAFIGALLPIARPVLDKPSRCTQI